MGTRKTKLEVSRKALALGAVLALGACATSPVKYDAGNMAQANQTLLDSQFNSEPLGEAPLTLDAVRQRALTHNAEFHHQLLKARTEIERSGLNAKSMMPKIYSHAHARWRNNTAASVGVKVSELDADMPEDFYTAQDRSSVASDLTMSWNLLDLGLASFRNAESKIDSYVSSENAAIGCNQLIVDVDSAYWRAVAFQRAEKRRVWLQSRIDYALALSNQFSEDRREGRLDELMFQRELIDIKRWYDSMFRNLASSQSELARLMNAPATAEFEVAPRKKDLELGQFSQRPVRDLIETAFTHRPEIRQTLYARDKSLLQNRQAMLRHLPAAGLFLGANTDSNSFLLNESFLTGGVSLTWDLLSLTQISNTKKQGKNRLELQEAHSQAVASAVVAQVLLAKRQVEDQQREVELAWKAKDIQAEITDRLSRDVANNLNREIFLIKEELLREMSILREDIARAELFAAESRLKQSLGQVQLCQTG